MTETETALRMDSHGCVWGGDSLLLCPSEQWGRGSCDCSPDDGRPVSAAGELAGALARTLHAGPVRYKITITAQSQDRATLDVRQRDGAGLTVEIFSGGPRPVVEITGRSVRMAPFATDALWHAASVISTQMAA